ncbi:hypothetical protein [uncultured Mediterranean phage uvMED]|nr:hypothetical protein [uncultured Mediterranean phage uvMED]
MPYPLGHPKRINYNKDSDLMKYDITFYNKYKFIANPISNRRIINYVLRDK